MAQVFPETAEYTAAFARAARPLNRRWLVVAAATLGMAGAYGGIGTISVLIEPLQSEFGWLRADLSLAYVLLTIGAAVGGLMMGRLADRFPPAPLALSGAIIIAAGMAALSLQSSVLGMQLVYLTMGLLGFAGLYAPLLTTVSSWFRSGHGFALGIVTAGGALGQAFVPTLFQALIIAYGWRDAAVILGCGFAVALAPVMLVIRKPRPGEVGAGGAPVAGQAWALHPALSMALLGAAALFCCGLMGVPTVHLISLVTSGGHAPTTATSVVAIAMLAGCAGRILTGLVVDRIGALKTYALVSAIQTLSTYGFVMAAEPLPLFAVAAVYGIGFGGVMTALVCAVRDAVPGRVLGQAMALVGLLAWVGMGAGGYQGGLCFDLTGSYQLSFALAALSGLANLATLAILGALLHRAAARRTVSNGKPVMRLALRIASRSGAA